MNKNHRTKYAWCIGAVLLIAAVLVGYALYPKLTPAIPLPPTPVATGGSLVLPTWTPDKPGATPVPGQLTRPNSARVQQGQAYEFRLYTHCGLDHSVDFDGSFWDVSISQQPGFAGSSRRQINNPLQKGIMTLVDASHARFEYLYEGLRTIEFVRHVGPKHIRECM